jgi:hypothetical protein
LSPSGVQTITLIVKSQKFSTLHSLFNLNSKERKKIFDRARSNWPQKWPMSKIETPVKPEVEIF